MYIISSMTMYKSTVAAKLTIWLASFTHLSSYSFMNSMSWEKNIPGGVHPSPCQKYNLYFFFCWISFFYIIISQLPGAPFIFFDTLFLQTLNNHDSPKIPFYLLSRNHHAFLEKIMKSILIAFFSLEFRDFS